MSTTFLNTKSTTARGHHTLLVASGSFAAVIVLGSLAARVPGTLPISWLSILAAATFTAVMCAALNMIIDRAFPPPATERDDLYTRHLRVYNVWSQHELDPELALARPHMLDVNVPETAALIRALHTADLATSRTVAEYREAVLALESALRRSLE